jgi:hypothetical protein
MASGRQRVATAFTTCECDNRDNAGPGAVKKHANNGTPIEAASRGAFPPSGLGTRNENIDAAA